MIQRHLENSLMLVTALNPHIGYEKCRRHPAKRSTQRGNEPSGKAGVALGLLTSEQRLYRYVGKGL